MTTNELEIWWVGEKKVITMTGLQVHGSVVYLNDADLTAELQTLKDVAVADSQFTLEYVAASDGVYVGTLPANAAITNGTKYNLIVTDDDVDEPVYRVVEGIARFRHKT